MSTFDSILRLLMIIFMISNIVMWFWRVVVKNDENASIYNVVCIILSLVVLGEISK